MERISNLHSAVTNPNTFCVIIQINCGKGVWRSGSTLVPFWSTCSISLLTLNHTYYGIFIHMCILVHSEIADDVTLRLHYFNESTYYCTLLLRLQIGSNYETSFLFNTIHYYYIVYTVIAWLTAASVLFNHSSYCIILILYYWVYINWLRCQPGIVYYIIYCHICWLYLFVWCMRFRKEITYVFTQII